MLTYSIRMLVVQVENELVEVVAATAAQENAEKRGQRSAFRRLTR